MNKLLALLALLISPYALAINTIATGFQVLPNEIKTIVAHGVCKKVWNNGTADHFIATKTSMEWTNFYVNTPTDLTVRDCSASCSNLKKMGVTTSGVYNLEIPGVGPALLYCEMTRDGGGWTRVFRHNISGGYFATPAAALSINQADPTANLYSILNYLDRFQTLSRVTYRMFWPSVDKRNIWSQVSIPTFEGPVMGYRGISIDDSTVYWGGLERANQPSRGITNLNRSLLDGSVNHNDWWFAIGSTADYSGGIPGPYRYTSAGVNEVDLYVHEGAFYPLSCQHILEMGESKGSGYYTIYPDQKNPVTTYCEMEVDNGGWTLIYANSAAADLPVKKSYLTHISEASGIIFHPDGPNHAHAYGALDTRDFDATQMMARDVGVWAPTDFSTLEFQNPREWKKFVDQTIVPHSDFCDTLDGAGVFRFRNSRGANYRFDTMNNFGPSNAGLGWGDCSGGLLDQTDASDVENYPRHWTYVVASAVDTERVRGIGGFNFGNTASIARYYAREKFNEPKNCMDILLSGKSRGDGSYTIYPEGSALTVDCDMTTDGGGWTKVWHGFPSHARYNNTTQEVYSRSNSITFNQMRMEGVHNGANITDMTLHTAYLKKTIPEYFQQVVAQTDASFARVKFADFNGVENVELAGNYFFFGYGNNWRVFYTCVNVDPLTADRIYLGGTYLPGCEPINTFNQSSISTCTSTSNFYCTNAMNSTEVDSVMGLTLKKYQETRVWVRSIPTMKSCKEIRDRGFSNVDGVYLIDPDGKEGPTQPFRAFCDMTTDGGGWTLVWSNTRGGTNKPVTNILYNDAINTRPRCSQANGTASDTTGECLLMVQGTSNVNWREHFNYFVGLKHWNDIAANEKFLLRYSWNADYGGATNRDAYGVVQPFNAADKYRLNIQSYRNTVGTQPPGLFSYHSGGQFSASDQDNDTHGTAFCGQTYSGTPFWYIACWSGSINGGGELSGGTYYNGAYWTGSAVAWGDAATGSGAGNGWMYIRETTSYGALKNSCKQILEDDPSSPSGTYTISPTPNVPGSQMVVYCDMTTDGGGWTLVSYSNGTATSTLPANFFAASHTPLQAFNHDAANARSSINPEAFSLSVGTTDAMFVSPSYNAGAPIIDNGFGTWDYNKTKCTGPLFHTSRTAGCASQAANDNFDTADALNLAFFGGNEAIVPNYGPEKCYSGKGSCSFKFFLRQPNIDSNIWQLYTRHLLNIYVVTI